MTFLQLTFAVEVANSTSINKAAERLYTSQSNVSNSIKALEDELGIKIFDRTKKGISVTEPGREFLSYAREILDKMDFVEDHFIKRAASGRNISVFPPCAPIFSAIPSPACGPKSKRATTDTAFMSG